MSPRPRKVSKALAIPSQPAPTATLTCHAPHPDPARKGQPCGSPLGHHVGAFEFDTTAKRMPHEPDGFTWARCSRESCKAWNRFRRVSAHDIAPVAPLRTLEERLAVLPLNQQVAAHALAGGLPYRRVAAQLGVDPSTVTRWKQDPGFLSIVLEIRPAITSTAVASVLQEFYVGMRKNLKGGSTSDHKWYLDRTLFFENKMALARAAKQEGANVSVNVNQQQQATQGAISSIWEKRGGVSIVSSTDREVE